MMGAPAAVPAHAAALAEMRAVLAAPTPEQRWWASLSPAERAIFARAVARPEVAELTEWYGIRAETRGELLRARKRWADWVVDQVCMAETISAAEELNL